MPKITRRKVSKISYQELYRKVVLEPKPADYWVADFQGTVSHFVSDNEFEVWDFVYSQEDPSDYRVYGFPAEDWDVWVK